MKFKEVKQKKACNGCPFKRNNTPCSADTDPSMPGGSHPFVYIGQARGNFWLPCHQDKNYRGVGSNPETVGQCRGAAIFRSNCDDQPMRPKGLLELPEDKENVFANEKEFIQHYLKIPDQQAEVLTSQPGLNMMLHQEMYKQSSTRRTYKPEN